MLTGDFDRFMLVNRLIRFTVVEVDEFELSFLLLPWPLDRVDDSFVSLDLFEWLPPDFRLKNASTCCPNGFDHTEPDDDEPPCRGGNSGGGCGTADDSLCDDLPRCDDL